jgi:hypothetical protein
MLTGDRGVPTQPAARSTHGFSVRLYRRLLMVYPDAYRHEYGPLMVQAFRDMHRAAIQHEGSYGILKLWLHTLLDLSTTAGEEHYEEFRRTNMGKTMEKLEIDPRMGVWLIIAALIVAGGVITNTMVKESGGPLLAGAAILILANLLAAIVIEVAVRTNGVTVASAIILILGHLIPLLWEPDPGAWLRENPVNVFLLLVLSLWAKPRNCWWLMPLVALILAAIQIAVSFLH